jgi:hypothetical protein
VSCAELTWVRTQFSTFPFYPVFPFRTGAGGVGDALEGRGNELEEVGADARLIGEAHELVQQSDGWLSALLQLLLDPRVDVTQHSQAVVLFLFGLCVVNIEIEDRHKSRIDVPTPHHLLTSMLMISNLVQRIGFASSATPAEAFMK